MRNQQPTKNRNITTAHAAALLHVTDRYVRMLIREGRLKGYKIGRDWLVSASAVRQFLKEREKESILKGE